MVQRSRVAAYALLCLLTSCSGGGGRPIAARASLPDERVHNEWPVGGEWRFTVPWAAPERLQSQEYELWQRAMAVCMDQKGFRYSPQKYFDTDVIYGRLNPLNKAVIQFGYEDPPQVEPEADPNANRSSPEYLEALVGGRGCANVGNGFVYGAPAAQAVGGLQDTLTSSADRAVAGFETSAVAAERVAAWHSCMKSRGFDFAAPADARTEFSGDGKVSDRELEARRADYECDVASKLTETRSKAEASAFAAWLDEHAEAVQQLEATQTEALREVADLSTKLTDEGAAALRGIDPNGDTTASTLPS